MALPPEPDVTLPWLVRLRWLFLVGQAVALATSAYLALDLRWAPLCAALAAGSRCGRAGAAAPASRRRCSSSTPRC
jgi:hypothetical protein